MHIGAGTKKMCVATTRISLKHNFWESDVLVKLFIIKHVKIVKIAKLNWNFSL